MYCNCGYPIESRLYSRVKMKMHMWAQSATKLQVGDLGECLQMQSYYY
jgi:hypothetical protein